jgi:hypothetical protein
MRVWCRDNVFIFGKVVVVLVHKQAMVHEKCKKGGNWQVNIVMSIEILIKESLSVEGNGRSFKVLKAVVRLVLFLKKECDGTILERVFYLKIYN